MLRWFDVFMKERYQNTWMKEKEGCYYVVVKNQAF